jgi:DNA-binding NarL/FixJ family response regulator
MKPTPHAPQTEHATLRLSLDVQRITGDRLAALIEQIRHAAGDEVGVAGLEFDPVALELCGPRERLEAMHAAGPTEGLRRALGCWRMTFGPIALAARPAAGRGGRVLVVDGDSARARADVEALCRAHLEACAVASIEAAEVMLRRSGLRFDAMVLRHGLADGEGLQLLERLDGPARGCSVLVVDERVRPELARAYQRLGAFRYIGPPASPLQLVGRVNATVLDTQAWREVGDPHAEALDAPPRVLLDPEQGADRLEHVFGLSPVERHVAVMLLLGLRDLEIAARLEMSERTAKRYVGKVLEKVGINNRASLWSVLHKDGLGAVVPAREGERASPPVAVRPSSPASPPLRRCPVASVGLSTTQPAA